MMQMRRGGNDVHLDAMLNSHHCRLGWEGRGGNTGLGHHPPALYSHLHNLSCISAVVGFHSSPSKGEDESIHSLPRDAVESM